MKYLIDTHVLIWFMEGNSAFSSIAKSLMIDKKMKFLSVSHRSGKFRLKTQSANYRLTDLNNEIADVLFDNLIEILPVDFAHTIENNKLPFHHRVRLIEL